MWKNIIILLAILAQTVSTFGFGFLGLGRGRSSSPITVPVQENQQDLEAKLIRELTSSLTENFPSIMPYDQRSIPQIVVLGTQSSGKSAVLEAITGVSLPSRNEKCTSSAVVIESIRDPGVTSFMEATVQFFDGTNRVDHARRITDPNRLVKSIESAESRACGRNQNFADHTKYVIVTVRSRHVHDMIVIDLPGAIQRINGRDDGSYKSNKNILDHYLTRNNVIILSVQGCDKLSLVEDTKMLSGDSLILLEKYRSERPPDFHVKTIRVLTKPDLCTAEILDQVLSEEVCQADSSWFIVQNLESADKDYRKYISDASFRRQFRDNEVRHLSNKNPSWMKAINECPTHFGADNLRKKLMFELNSLYDHVSAAFDSWLLEQEKVTQGDLNDAKIRFASTTVCRRVVLNEFIEESKKVMTDLFTSTPDSSESSSNPIAINLLLEFNNEISMTLDTVDLADDGQSEKYKKMKNIYGNLISVHGEVQTAVARRREVTKNWYQIAQKFTEKFVDEIFARTEKLGSQEDDGQLKSQKKRFKNIFQSKLRRRLSSSTLDNAFSEFVEQIREGYSANLFSLSSSKKFWYMLLATKYEKQDLFALDLAWKERFSGRSQSLFGNVKVMDAETNQLDITISSFGLQHSDSRILNGEVLKHLSDHTQLGYKSISDTTARNAAYGERKVVKLINRQQQYHKNVPKVGDIGLDRVIASMADVASYFELNGPLFIQNIHGFLDYAFQSALVDLEKVATNEIAGSTPSIHLKERPEAEAHAEKAYRRHQQVQRCHLLLTNWMQTRINAE